MIGFFLGIPAKLKLFAVALLGFMAILGMAVLKGQSIQKAKEASKDAKEYRKTTERMAKAKPVDRDPNAARKRLAKRNSKN